MATKKFATPPNSCELNKLLTRGWVAQVKPVGADPSEYKFVRGATGIDVNIETSTVDATDLDSDGWASDIKTGRSLTIAINGQYVRKGDLDLLSEDQVLLKYSGEELGDLGKIDFRVWRSDIDEGWEGTASNNFQAGSGDANGLRTFTSNLKSACAPTRIHSVEKGSETKESKPLDEAELLKVLAPAGTPASGEGDGTP